MRDKTMRRLVHLRAMGTCGFIGCVVAGACGHNGDTAQWASIVSGLVIGGLLDL